MFRYFCSLFLKYDRPIYPIVVFSYDRPQRLDKSSFEIAFPNKRIINFDYAEEEAMFQSELSTMELAEQEQIMQITTSWEEKGRLEGKLEGKLEEKLNITLRQLNRKLGNLPETIATRIKSLEPSQLDSLTEDLLEFETLDDLNRWFNSL